MRTIKGPAVFLAQFMGNEAPFNSLDGICEWAADKGYLGINPFGLDRSPFTWSKTTFYA